MDANGQPNSRDTYNPAFFEALYKAETEHFWFRARNSAIAALVRRAVSSFPSDFCVLEVGCGTGYVLQLLERICGSASVTGMDLFEEALQYARQRTSCRLVAGDVHNPPFTSKFHLVGMFDVLEHLPDDLQVLRDLKRLLLPSGMLLLTVPAHPALWSYFDVAARHCRRYTLQELRLKLADSGFEVLYASEFMAALFPLAWVKRRLLNPSRQPELKTAQEFHELALRDLKIIPLLNGLMRSMLAWEAPLIARRCRLPFGTSILALARKQPAPEATYAERTSSS